MIVDSLTPEVDPRDRAQTYWKPPETPVLQAAKRSYLGRVYLSWAQYPVTRVEELKGPESGYLVRFQDFRFMYPEFTGRGTLGGWVQLDQNLNVVRENFGLRTVPD